MDQDNQCREALGSQGTSLYLAQMPLDWVIRAGSLPGKSLQVALIIRHLAKIERKIWVKLKNKHLLQMSVTRDSKRRALENLEKAGLIEIVRRQGGNPMVRVIEC